MKIFIEYLKLHWRVLSLYFVFSLIFIVFFILYQIPVQAAAYSGAVCLFVGGFVVIPHFIRFCKKHQRLTEMKREAEMLLDYLPAPEGILEEDYQKLLQILEQRRQHMADENSRKYTDMIDYYTLWAHQIKTPIASMHLNLQNEDSEFARSVQGDLMRIEQYVDMVLCYLRLDSEESDYIFQEYDLDGIIRQALRKFAPLFIRKKIKLVYEFCEMKILTDEKWLLFVIEQILSNALKYSKPGGRISIEQKEAEILCIRDTGIGIEGEDLPRIFDKGYTGYNGRRDKKASGIGLYLCRRICTNLGHRIWVHSAPGEGSAFFLDLGKRKAETD